MKEVFTENNLPWIIFSLIIVIFLAWLIIFIRDKTESDSYSQSTPPPMPTKNPGKIGAETPSEFFRKNKQFIAPLFLGVVFLVGISVYLLVEPSTPSGENSEDNFFPFFLFFILPFFWMKNFKIEKKSGGKFTENHRKIIMGIIIFTTLMLFFGIIYLITHGPVQS